LVRVESDSLRKSTNESAIKNTAWQQVKFFVFDSSQKSGADTRFFRDLIERDASKFPGFFETGSKVCHQVNEWAVSLRLAPAS
jgi:hypothetical protein